MGFFDVSIYKIIQEGLIGSVLTIWNMVYIIVPLMIGLEIAKHYKWVEKATAFTAPFLKKIGLGYNGTFPLLIGIFFGITYGSGVMIDTVNQGEIDKKDISTILVFLVICHAIIEDTFILWSIGSDFFILFFGRILGAIFITGLYSKLTNKSLEAEDRKKVTTIEED